LAIADRVEALGVVRPDSVLSDLRSVSRDAPMRFGFALA
jgi:hypothetical protein